ncbi:MAG: hypothetical protein KAT01_07290 [Candidatus Aminicenantes bacterium]|nr:hypothetical protein [Candidatus Aminicenantes bacterium]
MNYARIAQPFVPSKDWAEMFRKVYEVDPLLCPSCGGKMSIISFIEDHKVIDKIIAHLKLTFMLSFFHNILREYISSPDFFVFDHKVSL